MLRRPQKAGSLRCKGITKRQAPHRYEAILKKLTGLQNTKQSPMRSHPQKLSGLQKAGLAKGVWSKELGFVDAMIHHLACDSVTDNQE